MKIESGIPLPDAKAGGRPCIYPFGEMKIGQSILVKPRKGETLEAVARRVRSAAATWRSRNTAAVGFKVRITPDEGGVRCWMSDYSPR